MEREQSWLTGGDDDEDDSEDYHWLDSLGEQVGEVERDQQTYMTLVNEMRKSMKKGQQAWNSYGDRTNAFLLINYGFCFPDNLYDSAKFCVRLDVDFTKNNPPKIEEMIAPWHATDRLQ